MNPLVKVDFEIGSLNDSQINSEGTSGICLHFCWILHDAEAKIHMSELNEIHLSPQAFFSEFG